MVSGTQIAEEKKAVRMLNQSTLLTQANPAGGATTEVIKSRFGEVTVSLDKAVLFPRGMLGMPDRNRFALAGFPNPKMQQFMLMQSLDDPDLAFIALPLEMENKIVASADIRSALRDLQIEENTLAVLLIVSVHRGMDQIKLSVNARAPLFIDIERKIGVQYVFPQDVYKVQHML
jgi:flagellar assembly factor FliW